MTDRAARPTTVLVSEPDAVRRRTWMAVLRAAGVSVRAAAGSAERAKALADGRVAVELSSVALPASADAPTPVRLCVPADLPDAEVAARVRAALAGAPDAGAPGPDAASARP
ncbi:MAG: hypothetical protein KJT01_13480 [Gemmatimonadetes bacterium]|nr:hypothetical protein [Gemmatimonadota bacterium]